MDKLEEEFARAMPLVELLERVPAGARMTYEHLPTHHQMIPVGRLCREAADALVIARKQVEELEAERDGLREAVDYAFGIFAKYATATEVCELQDRVALHRKGVEPKCCDGGPQWGHAWDCPKCPE